MKKILLSASLALVPLAMSLSASAECAPSFSLDRMCDAQGHQDGPRACDWHAKEVSDHTRGAYTCTFERGRCEVRQVDWRGACDNPRMRFNEHECRATPYCQWNGR